MKALTDYDLQELYLMYQSPVYKRFFRHFPEFLSFGDFLTFLKSIGTIIKVGPGIVVVRQHPRTRVADVSVILPQEEQFKGEAFNIIQAVTRVMVRDYGAPKVMAVVSEEDERANQLLEKGGFQQETTTYGSCYYDGVFYNENHWAMTAKEFKDLYGFGG